MTARVNDTDAQKQKATSDQPERRSGAQSFRLASWLLIRLLGLIYCIAFISTAQQILGLVGSDGIIPAHATLEHFTQIYSAHTWIYQPTLFWLNSSDQCLLLLTSCGIGSALLVALGVATGPALFVCWLTYLSIVNVAPAFFNFQWDNMLLESGLLGLFLVAWQSLDPFYNRVLPPVKLVPLWLFRCLLFRVIFFSAVVKLTSSSDSWRNLTALTNYYETQLLPNAFAWYMHNLPRSFQIGSACAALLLELIVPFFIFAPARLRTIAAALIAGSQLVMFLTGNHGFINLLTIALCVTLFDDDTLQKLLPGSFKYLPESASTSRMHKCIDFFCTAALALIVVFTCATIYQNLGGTVSPALSFYNDAYHLTGRYGLYPIVMPERTEIIVEGSNDLVDWRPYEFKCHVGEIGRAPPTVAPYQPRLDWLLRFAALSSASNSPWFDGFISRLLTGSNQVAALLQTNPFANQPPRYIRADVYRYSFTSNAERQATGNWWKRTLIARYLDPRSLSVQTRSLTRSHEQLILWDGRRKPVFSGSWYPSKAGILNNTISELVKKAQTLRGTSFSAKSIVQPISSPITALVLPHAGYDYSGVTAVRGYLAVLPQNVKRVFLLGPYHRCYSGTVRGAALPESTMFGTPIGDLNVDRETVNRLASQPLFEFNEKAHCQEHSLEMQLPLIRYILPQVKIVPILLGSLANADEVQRIADTIRAEVRDGDLVVASGDMTHYGAIYDFVPFKYDIQANVQKLDEQAYSLMQSRDISGFLRFYQETGDYSCGISSNAVLMALLPRKSHATVLDYSDSQKSSGARSAVEKQRCVSYLAIAFSGEPWAVKKLQSGPSAKNSRISADQPSQARAATLPKQ